MRNFLLVVMITLALGAFAVAVAADTSHHKTGTDTPKEKHATIYLTKIQVKEIKDATGKPAEIKLTDHQKEVIKDKFAKFTGTTLSVTKDDLRTKHRVRVTSNDEGVTLTVVPPPKTTEQPKQ
jgi:hypothetical protein